MDSVGTSMLWSVFSIIIFIMLAIDIFLQKDRSQHGMTMKQAAIWSLIWIFVSLLFCIVFWWHLMLTEGSIVANTQALTFITVYLIEKALSIDNVFIWLMLFNCFDIPTSLQHRVLIYGVVGAIILRTFIIFTGSWLIIQFNWILYVFSPLLLLTSMKILVAKESETKTGDRLLVKWLRYHLRITDKIENGQFFVYKDRVLFATPLLIVLILVELSDIIFAVDSIPAILSTTTDPFIALTSNLFAILGLRAMYFLLANIAERFFMLKYGLSIILIFIGIKILISDFFLVPIAVSLGIIFGILALTIIFNVLVSNRNNKKQ